MYRTLSYNSAKRLFCSNHCFGLLQQIIGSVCSCRKLLFTKVKCWALFMHAYLEWDYNITGCTQWQVTSLIKLSIHNHSESYLQNIRSKPCFGLQNNIISRSITILTLHPYICLNTMYFSISIGATSFKPIVS